MTSNPPTTLAVSLIIAFVVLFMLGIYSLLFRKGRSTLPYPAHLGAAGPSPHSVEDEWEASAPYPEHAMRAVQQARMSDRTNQAAGAFHDMQEQIPDDTHPTQDLHDAWKSFQEAVEPEPQASPSPPSSVATATQIRCPCCLSSRIDTRNVARKAGSTIGSVAGATGGIAAALAGAETGAVVGSIAGPLGTVFGGLAGAVIAGLVGSAAGCAAGSAVGAAIDDNVLDNHLCLSCGHAFSVQQD